MADSTNPLSPGSVPPPDPSHGVPPPPAHYVPAEIEPATQPTPALFPAAPVNAAENGYSTGGWVYGNPSQAPSASAMPHATNPYYGTSGGAGYQPPQVTHTPTQHTYDTSPPLGTVAVAPATTFARKEAPKNFHSTDASLAGIVDTIEAIIIALILALSFRAFVVEAFVIPTGSMAPTLLGAHFDVICPKCGYAFKRNARLNYQYMVDKTTRSPMIGDFGNRAELSSNRTIPSNESPSVDCPNCHFPIDPVNFPQNLPPVAVKDSVSGRMKQTPFAWANNGDRILVLKYLYAILDPHRFDVIVFKEPMTARDNYIKRLIGLPGETIEIVNGDVFIAPPGKHEPADMQIARKPEFLQRDLWQVVYNNDYYPTDEGVSRNDGRVWSNPWAGTGPTANAWQIHGPAIQYAAPSAGALEFASENPSLFNILGYNNDFYELRSSKQGFTLLQVGDLRLESEWTPTETNGTSISMTLGHTRNRVRSVWSSAGLTIERFNTASDKFEAVESLAPSAVPIPKAGESYRIALENVDHLVRFFVNGKVILTHETPWTGEDALVERQFFLRHPGEDLPLIRLDVGGACSLGHLKLFRDLYYTQNDPDQIHTDTANTNHPLTLAADEFFALGDNSRESLDGRGWNSVYPALDDIGTPQGVVPRRYLLGKAFFVYWPAGYRVTTNDDIPVLSNAPLVPNVGEMRLIR